MDKTDIELLKHLQRDARISNVELAERINLSPTPCLRRLRKLEKDGVIKGYAAVLDRKQLGLAIYACAFIKLLRNTTENASKFEQTIGAFPEVIECCVITGRHDYMLRIVATDLESYQKFLKEKIAGIGQVADIESTLVLDQVMSRTTLPLERL